MILRVVFGRNLPTAELWGTGLTSQVMEVDIA
jgi:hypothetical protein